MKLIIDPKARQEVRNDISKIQISSNKEIFSKAIEFFNQKWSEEVLFLDYFNKEWVDELNGWYEGYAPGIPSTDNALEAVNLQVKQEHMFGNRTPVGQFLELIKQDIVRGWSVIRNPENINAKIYSNSPDYKLEDATYAYQWIQNGKSVQVKKASSVKLNFIPSGSTNQIDKEVVDNFMRARLELNWSSLDKLFEMESSIWCVVLQETDWKSGKCSCPYFSKNYKCKHVLVSMSKH